MTEHHITVTMAQKSGWHYTYPWWKEDILFINYGFEPEEPQSPITIPLRLAYKNINCLNEHEEIAQHWEKYNPTPAVIVERIVEPQKRRWPWFLLGLALTGIVWWL